MPDTRNERMLACELELKSGLLNAMPFGNWLRVAQWVLRNMDLLRVMEKEEEDG